jgi:hypothetical protein
MALRCTRCAAISLFASGCTADKPAFRSANRLSVFDCMNDIWKLVQAWSRDGVKARRCYSFGRLRFP